MGESTFVNQPVRTSRRTKSNPLHLQVDVPLLMVTVTLIIFGLIILFSASADFSFRDSGSSWAITLRQIRSLAVGLIAAFLMTFIDYRIWKRYAVVLMIITLALLAVVLAIGDERLGAVRSFLNGSIQPSELAKIATIIYLGVWLNAKRDVLDTWGFGIVPLGAILGVVSGLIMLQPDLSAALTIIILGGLMFFLADVDLRRILILFVIAAAAGYILIRFNPTGSDRLQEYIAGRESFSDASYHVQRAIAAFVSGGWFGVGIGQGVVKDTGLPVPYTDSIFAVVAEETGVVGVALLIGLYLFLMWRALVIAQRAPDDLGRLLAAGIGLWITLEALINMAVIIGLLPFAGNALPFVSSGGSNLAVTLTGIGILLNISRQSMGVELDKERILNAFIDLRWRDRRRRVSRPRRSAG